ERGFHGYLGEGIDISSLNRVIEEMKATSIRDLLGEGIKPNDAVFSVELELTRPDGAKIQAKCPQLHFVSGNELRRKLGPGFSQGEASIELVRMRVSKVISKPALVMSESGPEDPIPALVTERAVAYGGSHGRAKVYKWESLKPGNKLQGCLILEAQNSTYFVPEGWNLEIDQYGNAQLTCAAGRVSNNLTHATLQESRAYGRQS